MIEVARAILETRGRDNEMYFNDLVNEIQNYLEKSDADIRNALPFFYSDLNTDGSFIPLGDNKWGLRSWYAIDEIDEEVITLEDTDENAPKRKNKKVNAFMDGDEDAIDYNDDDPEDENFTPDSDSLEYDDDSEDDEKAEVESYDSELNEIIPDDDLDDVELSEEDDDDDSEKVFAVPRINFALSTYYKGTGLEEILKKLEEYLDNASKSESDITKI